MDEDQITDNNVNVEISVDQNGNIDPVSLEYNEYRKDLNSIYKATSDNNAIMSDFIIDNDKCRHKLVIKYANGLDSLEKDFEFDYNDNFKSNFLIPMIEDYNKYNVISSDNVVIKENGKTACFTASTKDNDRITIDNIDAKTAGILSDIVKKEDANNSNLTDSETIKRGISERGVGSTVAIVLTVILIGITLVGTIYFTIMANK